MHSALKSVSKSELTKSHTNRCLVSNQDRGFWWGRLTALWANVSPFPELMQGVFCCLSSFSFLLWKAIVVNAWWCRFDFCLILGWTLCSHTLFSRAVEVSPLPGDFNFLCLLGNSRCQAGSLDVSGVVGSGFDT